MHQRTGGTLIKASEALTVSFLSGMSYRAVLQYTLHIEQPLYNLQ